MLEVRIDRRDGARVSVADCAQASRAISARLDAGGAALAGASWLEGRYELQVSSPGGVRRQAGERTEGGADGRIS